MNLDHNAVEATKNILLWEWWRRNWSQYSKQIVQEILLEFDEPILVRLKKWYLIHPCLTLSNIRYVLRVKWSNPGKGAAPSLHLSVVAIEKGAFWSPAYLYIYIYTHTLPVKSNWRTSKPFISHLKVLFLRK